MTDTSTQAPTDSPVEPAGVSDERLKLMPTLLRTWAVPYLEATTMPFARELVLDAATACDELKLARQQLAEMREWIENEAWSFVRRVLEQGMAIQQDNANGKYPTYEHLSARLDEAARERVELLNAFAEGK